MSGPSPRALWKYVCKRLGLEFFFGCPGDGRPQPRIPARALLWSMLLGQVLRRFTFHGLEALVHAGVRRNLAVDAGFGDDTLGYFTERLNADALRVAMARTLRQAKRNKAFENSRFIGLAIDGTTAGRSTQTGCPLCRPFRDAAKEVVGYRHHLAAISVVGAGLSLPFDVEPYGPKDSEYRAAQRLLRRAVDHLGSRFADYLVVDGGLATAPFLHAAGDVGLPVIARLKGHTGLLADQSVASSRRCQVPVSPGQESLGNRESRIQRRQDTPWAGTHLPSPPQQSPDHLADHHVGSVHRAALSTALSSSR